MAHIIILIPATIHAGVKTISLGLNDTLSQKNVRVCCLPELDTDIVEKFLVTKQTDDLLENIFAQYKNISGDKDIVIINGLPLSKPYAAELNYAISTALNAAIIFVGALGQNQDIKETMQQLKILANPYKDRHKNKILGFILNKANPIDTDAIEKHKNSLAIKMPLLGVIPYKNTLAEQNRISLDQYLVLSWVWPFLNNITEANITPAMFRYNLIYTAKQANKKIILPEGTEHRTIQAANICAARGLARCILLGEKQEIYDTCAKINLKLNDQIAIIEPKQVRENYVNPLCEARNKKGLTPEKARKLLEDNTVLGTMMLHLGEADGLVSGATHTTADTIRPALQIIKTAPNVKLVSSVFFMCLPDQVLVYGDCAINPNPTAEELADIAIQSADSAAAFGITPRVTMLSYSTCNSGSGPDVIKVKTATEIAKQLRPDLEIDGPLQYDAAIEKTVATLKAPNSKIAGRATVFVFPDLDAGNIAYKTVQRSTGIICIGPILQGLRKPVNDLSRGCTINDIVFTIAITAVQAS
jgi:phosphate acetyltransferase